jgi:hypothetical protein
VTVHSLILVYAFQESKSDYDTIDDGFSGLGAGSLADCRLWWWRFKD